MSIWTLLEQILPLAGNIQNPFSIHQEFVSANFCQVVDFVMQFRQLLINAKLGANNSNKQVSNKSDLEFAVRLSANGIEGAAIIGVPIPGQSMTESLDKQKNLFSQICQDLSPEELTRQLDLFDIVYPQNGDFNWLDAQSRALLLGLAYRQKSSQLVIKPYYTSNLDKDRSHEQIIKEFFTRLSLESYLDMAVAFDQAFNDCSVHRGIGLDVIAGQQDRVKLYHRFSWLEADRVDRFATEWSLEHNKELFDKCRHFFCPDGNEGATREFETSLVIQSPPVFKCNFFLSAGGEFRLNNLISWLNWPKEPVEELLQLCMDNGYFVHAVAMSMDKSQPKNINLYFMRKQK